MVATRGPRWPGRRPRPTPVGSDFGAVGPVGVPVAVFVEQGGEPEPVGDAGCGCRALDPAVVTSVGPPWLCGWVWSACECDPRVRQPGWLQWVRASMIASRSAPVNRRCLWPMCNTTPRSSVITVRTRPRIASSTMSSGGMNLPSVVCEHHRRRSSGRGIGRPSPASSPPGGSPERRSSRSRMCSKVAMSIIKFVTDSGHPRPPLPPHEHDVGRLSRWLRRRFAGRVARLHLDVDVIDHLDLDLLDSVSSTGRRLGRRLVRRGSGSGRRPSA